MSEPTINKLFFERFTHNLDRKEQEKEIKELKERNNLLTEQNREFQSEVTRLRRIISKSPFKYNKKCRYFPPWCPDEMGHCSGGGQSAELTPDLPS